jgi:hypothetical protein
LSGSQGSAPLADFNPVKYLRSTPAAGNFKLFDPAPQAKSTSGGLTEV